MDLIIASFNILLSEVDAQSRGTVLKRFLSLNMETEMFMNEKGEVVAQLDDESGFGIWHCYMISPTT
jgi:hypothetical protein